MRYTHKVVITITSEGDKPNINMAVEWDPLLTDEAAQEQGFVPASYRVAETLLLGLDHIIDPDSIIEIAEEDLGLNRTLN